MAKSDLTMSRHGFDVTARSLESVYPPSGCFITSEADPGTGPLAQNGTVGPDQLSSRIRAREMATPASTQPLQRFSPDCPRQKFRRLLHCA